MTLNPIPGRLFFRLLVYSLPLFVAGVFWFPFLVGAVALDIAFFLLGILEYRQAKRLYSLRFSVEGSRFFSIGRKNSLTLKVYNQGSTSLNLEVRSDVPQFWEDLQEPGFKPLAVNGVREEVLTFKPMRRGVYRIEYVHYRFRSPSGLLYLYGKEKVDLEIEVYPDVKAVSRYLTLTRRNRLAEMGIHKNRFRGRGTNLDCLRDYQDDDDSRRIEWKASTRLNKLVCKEFQVESNNQIAVVLDCGRLMTAEQDGLSALDHAVNATLILAYVAHKIGDSITLFAFNDGLIGQLPPIKGKNMLPKVLEFVTRLQPSFVESNYQEMFEQLRVRLKRRSLIVLFSDLLDDINYGVFYKYLSLLGRKHLPLIILLRDILLQEHAGRDGGAEEAYVSAAAADMYMRRAESIKKFRQKKVNLLDVLPREVTPALIDKYLELKSRNLV